MISCVFHIYGYISITFFASVDLALDLFKLRRCDMSKPEVAEHVTPRFYMFSYPFFLLSELGEANTWQDNKLS